MLPTSLSPQAIMDILLDTSILLRRTDVASAHHADTLAALDRLSDRNCRLVIARQNCVEFRGVASRPVAVNGLGMTPEQADARLDEIQRLFTLLPESDAVYEEWRDLCRRAGVSGEQVHDTRLVAACVVSGVQVVLTWNPRDFALLSHSCRAWSSSRPPTCWQVKSKESLWTSH